MPNNPFMVILSKNWLLLLFGIFFTAAIFTAANFSGQIRPSHTVVQGVAHLVDTKKQYSIANILSATDSIWQQLSQDLTRLGLSGELHWFKFTISHIRPAEPRLLEIEHAQLDSVNIWFTQDKKILAAYHAGDTLTFSERTIKHDNFIFPVPTSGDSIEVYVSTYSKGLVGLPVHIWTQNEYLKFTSKSGLIMGGFFGLILAIGLINLFFLSQRAHQYF